MREPSTAQPLMEDAPITAEAPSRSPIVSNLQGRSRQAAIAVVVICLLALVGWVVNSDVLISVVPGRVSMKPNTAVGLMLSSGALLLGPLRSQPHAATSPRLRQLVARGLASAVLVLGLLTLLEYSLGLQIGINRLIFEGPPERIDAAIGGRPAPNTAINFLLTGLALWLLTLRWYRAAQTLGATVFFVALMALTGHLYSVTDLYRVGSLTGMAVQTAIAFGLLALGLLFAHPDQGWMRPFSSPYDGGTMMRRILPLVIGLPILLGFVILVIYDALALFPEGAIALRSILSITLFAAVIWWNGRSLNHIDAQRESVQQRFTQELEQQVAARTAELQAANQALRAENARRERAEVSLRESETRMRRAITFAPFPIAIHAEDGQMLTINRTWTDLTGYTAQDIPTVADWTERAYGERQAIVQNLIDRLYQIDDRVHEGEFAVKTKTGAIRTWDFSSAPLGRSADGRRLVISIAADITERKRLETALRDSQFQLQRQLTEVENIYRYAPIGLSVVDRDFRYLRINEYLAARNGLPIAAHLGSTIREMIPGLAAAIEPILADVLRTGEPSLNVEVQGETPAQPGRQRTWLQSCWPVKEGDRIVAFNTVSQEITDRKRLEADLEASRIALARQLNELETIYQSAPIGLSVLDPELRFVRINKRLAEINGVSVDSHIGHPVRLVLPDLADTLEQFLRSVLETGEPILDVEIRGETPAQPGVQRIWRESFWPLKDGDRIIGINTVCEEITEYRRTRLALQTAQSQLEVALDAGQVYPWQLDFAANKVITNRPLAALFGLDPASADAGFTIDQGLDMIHPDDRPQVAQALQTAMAEGRSYQTEFRICPPNREESWALSRGQITFDPEGNPAKLLGVVVDITERKQLEVALRDSEARFRTLFRTMEDGFCIVELLYNEHDRPYDHRFIDVNPAFERQTGMTNVIGKTALEVVPELGAESYWFERYDQVLRTRQPVRFENSSAALNRWFEVHAFCPDGEHRPRVAILFREISDRKQAQVALAERAAQQSAIAQVGQQALMSENLDAFLQWVTERTAAVLEVEYCKLLEIVDDDQALFMRAGVGWEAGLVGQAWVPRGNDSQAGYTLLTQEPTVVEDLRTDPRFNGPKLLTHHGVVSGMSTVIGDIEHHPFGVIGVHTRTQRHFTENDVNFLQAIANILAASIANYQNEQAIQQINASLELRVEERTQQLSDANQELEAFAYSVSHDLRAPLRAIEGLGRILQEDYGDRLDATGHDYLQLLVDSASRLDELIQDLLAYSRLGRREINLSPVNLQSLMEQILRELSLTWGDAPPQITIEPLPMVWGQRVVLRQVITNLITNAIKFVAAGTVPQIQIWAEEVDDDWVQIWIADNGVGIAPRHQNRIFRPFERLFGIEQYPGTGIGLAIVQRGISRLGGQVGVESTVGEGSRFWFRLRRA